MAPALSLGIGLAACAPTATPDGELHRRYTLGDVQSAIRAGATLPAGASFPSGIDPTKILTAGSPNDRLNVLPAFSEGAPAGYVVTDLWVNFDAVWIQPWYVLLTAWNEMTPRQNQLKDADGKRTPALFDVGPASAFYSPLWKVIYAVVPPGTAPDHYQSTRQLMDDRVPLHDGAPWVYAIRPATVDLGTGKPLQPITGQPVGTLSAVDGALIEGQLMPYFNIGANNFRFDAGGVVEEVPLFVFATRDESGAPMAWDAPAVVGSSPLFSRRAVDVSGSQPRFGAYVRYHLAYLPPTAAAFDRDAYPDTVARLAAASPAVDAVEYQGRVALNGKKIAATDQDCFADAMFPASCRWLDSQQAIEQALGTAGIERTGVTACAPLVYYGGKAVGAP